MVGHRHGSAAEILGIEGDKVAYHDFVVSAPKSVSIAAMVGGDDRVITVFDCCVARTFECLEEAVCVRVWEGDFVRTENVRQTGNAVSTVYRHEASWFLDPQLHAHLVFANVTSDKQSERWLALQPKQMAEESKRIRIEFYRELAEECRNLGCGITQGAGRFRIAEIEDSLEKRFSQRTRQRENFESRYQANFWGSARSSSLSRKGRALKDEFDEEDGIVLEPGTLTITICEEERQVMVPWISFRDALMEEGRLRLFFKGGWSR